MLRMSCYDIRFTLCELWSRFRAVYLKFCIFGLQYSSERIPADIGDMSIIRCQLYFTFAADTEHHIRFVLSQAWSRLNPAFLYFCICRLQHLKKCSSAAIVHLSALQRALYSTYAANKEHDIRFALRQLWYGLRPAYYQFCIFKLEYSSERISAAIRDMSTILSALYSTDAAKYVERHPVCGMSPLV